VGPADLLHISKHVQMSRKQHQGLSDKHTRFGIKNSAKRWRCTRWPAKTMRMAHSASHSAPPAPARAHRGLVWRSALLRFRLILASHVLQSTCISARQKYTTNPKRRLAALPGARRGSLGGWCALFSFDLASANYMLQRPCNCSSGFCVRSRFGCPPSSGCSTSKLIG